MEHPILYWWLSARLQYHHCLCTGDIAVLQWAINVINTYQWCRSHQWYVDDCFWPNLMMFNIIWQLRYIKYISWKYNWLAGHVCVVSILAPCLDRVVDSATWVDLVKPTGRFAYDCYRWLNLGLLLKKLPIEIQIFFKYPCYYLEVIGVHMWSLLSLAYTVNVLLVQMQNFIRL